MFIFGTSQFQTQAQRMNNLTGVRQVPLYGIWINISIMCLLPSMCATLPTSQWSQLKMGRRLESGCGRKAAPIGCTNASTVVAHPRIACGLSSADQSFNSRKIRTKAAIVNPHVSNMNIRCHWNEIIVNTSLTFIIQIFLKLFFKEWSGRIHFLQHLLLEFQLHLQMVQFVLMGFKPWQYTYYIWCKRNAL